VKIAEALKKPKTLTQQDEWWSRIITKRAEKMMAYYDNGNQPTGDLLKIELDGGDCLKCGKPWKRIEFSNVFLRGGYHEPDCWCHIRCPICHQWQYEETSNGDLLREDNYCYNCGWHLIKDNEPFHGERFERMFKAMTEKQRGELMRTNIRSVSVEHYGRGLSRG